MKKTDYQKSRETVPLKGLSKKVDEGTIVLVQFLIGIPKEAVIT